jgi:hypothetical protein
VTLQDTLQKGLEHLKARFNVTTEFLKSKLIVNTDLEEESVVCKEGVALEETIPPKSVKNGAELSDRGLPCLTVLGVIQHVLLEVAQIVECQLDVSRSFELLLYLEASARCCAEGGALERPYRRQHRES